MNRHLPIVVALVAGLLTSVSASDSDMSQEALAQIKELESFLVGRTGVYELDFAPFGLQRIVLESRSGEAQVYHYMTFRLRNRVSASAAYLMENARHFDQVMETILRQYDGLRFDREDGVRLVVENAPNVDDERLRTILEREDLEVRPRRINITVQAYDEHKSSFRLFDEFYEFEAEEQRAELRAQGREDDDVLPPQKDRFAFRELGERRIGAFYRQVHDLIEERESMRLYTPNEIRRMRLPPYDPGRLDPVTDEIQGQIHGVIIFDRLPIHGNHITVEVQGLSNKLRSEVPPHAENQLEDYFNARTLRRTYVIEYRRFGDEHFRDLDPFSKVAHGWQWVPSFQRLRNRSTMAYVRYFLNNIRNDDGTPNRRIEEHFWRYYEAQRSTVLPQALNQTKESLERAEAALEAYYQEQLAYREVPAHQEAVQAVFNERRAMLRERRESVQALLEALPEHLPAQSSFLDVQRLQRMLQEGTLEQQQGGGRGAGGAW